MVTNKRVLRMTFTNAVGGTVSITLPNPREDVTGPEIEAVMDTIIAKNVFTSAGGDLVAKKDIKLVDTNTSDLYDPPMA